MNNSSNSWSFICLAFFGMFIKYLLIPGYQSTDFDVHHNWLRITYTKPLTQWYYDEQSKWTLDYPPFFAYFQYNLAIIGQLFIGSKLFNINHTQINGKIPRVQNDILYFQKISVILTDIFFLYVLYLIFNRKFSFSLAFSYLFLPFIILDNIHFQYNILLQSIFLLSLYFMIKKQNYLIAGIIYSILLNFKHIYIYCGLAYLGIILKNYVIEGRGQNSIEKQTNLKQSNSKKIKRFLKVAIFTLIPFMISFIPFFMVGGLQYMKQILNRLFPFGRGLIHEYWAPNFWALYHLLDKIISFILRRLGFILKNQLISVTSERGSQYNVPLNTLKILPEPSANITIIIILFTLIPLIFYIFKANKLNMLNTILVNGLLFFMFGYHVHQKAITPYLHVGFVFLMSQFENSNKKYQNQSINKQQTLQGQKYKKQSNNLRKNELKNKQIRHNQQQYEQSQQFIKKDSLIVPEQNKFNKSIINYQQLQFYQSQIYCLIFFNIINLYPLLIENTQKSLKIVIMLIYYILMINMEKIFLKVDYQMFKLKNKSEKISKSSLIQNLFSRKPLKFIFLINLALVLGFLTEIILPLINFATKNKFQFLPLLLNSCICAGINLIWLTKIYIRLIKCN